MDRVTKKVRSKIMSAVKMKDSKIESDFRKALWSKGLRYRKNVKNLFGKPDMAISKYKIVIFIDSCFWHGCTEHYRKPKTSKKYWEEKISRNIKRDEEVSKYYNDRGWKMFRIWEHDLQTKKEKIIKSIFQHYKEKKNGK